MSIRPVDMQVLLPRSSEVNRITNNDNKGSESQQQQFAQMLTKQTEHEQQQVVSAFRSENPNVDKDGSNKNGQNARNRKKQSGAKEEEDVRAQKNAVYSSKGILDIQV